MNRTLAAQADVKVGGHYAPKRGDERFKHKVADQMNDALCATARLEDYQSRGAIRSLLDRVAEFEEIFFKEAR